MQAKDIFDLLTESPTEDAKDIFDEIAPDQDIFDRIEVPVVKMVPLKELAVKEEPKKEEPKRLLSDAPPKPEPKPLTIDDILHVVRTELARLPKPEEKIVEKVIEKETIKTEVVKEVPVNDTKAVDDLRKKLKKIEKAIEEAKDMARQPLFVPGGSGVIGIPPPEGNEGKVLTVVNDKAKWGTAGSSDAYTTSNVTTTRTLDPTTSSIDDLYNVVASLIVSLKGAGIIQ